MNRWTKWLVLWMLICLVITFAGGWLVAAMMLSLVFTMWAVNIAWNTVLSYRVIRDMITCPKCGYLLSTLVSAEATGEEVTPDQLYCGNCKLFYNVKFEPVMVVKKKDES